MMKLIKISICILLNIIVTHSAFSAQWTNGQQEINNVIWIPGNHGFYVGTSTFHDPEGCWTQGSGGLYLFDITWESQNEKTVDRIYSMILMAFSTGKKVHVFVDGCVGQAPKIVGLQLNI